MITDSCLYTFLILLLHAVCFSLKMEAAASSETQVNLHVERYHTPEAAFLQSVSLPNHYILDRFGGLPIHVKNEFFGF